MTHINPNDAKPKNIFEWIEDLMEETGCDYKTATKMYDLEHFPDDYDPEAYNE